MLVFSYGIPKSGSTLAFHLATGISLLGGHWQPKLDPALRRPGLPIAAAIPFTKDFPKGPAPSQTVRDRLLTFQLQWAARRAARRGHGPAVLAPEWDASNHGVPFVQTLDPAVLPRLVEAAGQGILLIKTHAAPSEEWLAAYRGFAAQGLARVHVNHRDPRDVCLALVDAARISRERGTPEFVEFATLEAAACGVQRYLAEAARWNGMPGVLHLRYETCAFQTDAAIDCLKADLGVECRSDLVRHYALRLAYTQRNKAAPNRHRDELDPGQRERLTEMFGPYLRAWGYLAGR
ncbi:hypothetical protein KTR66_22365 [Roseococcus sp. SDR]|uniref:hypothetical protein n=1 Tax=Roseococcus sp. SDR TaxID=2835532 RepID=UPI001BCB9BC9|nr:hypothetical protein [Roseococcus sp. SDR]MBS7792751.1 hypothetical protein [Roseococcus sp. SDR]MBV1848065.1 hypothetical protein [Roseococcus sp. SDR]